MPMRPILLALMLTALLGCSTATPPDTAARVSHWIDTLRVPDAKQRKEAAFKLGNLGQTEPVTVVPALIGALSDTDATVRSEAILALVKCGPEAKEAMVVLTKLQKKDPDARVR